MWEIEDHFKVRVGGNTYIDTPDIIVYKGQSLFTLKRHSDNGYLGIYFEIYDSVGQRVASVKRNEIYFGDKEQYEIAGSLNRYVFKERSTGRILCDIKRREDSYPAELDVSAALYTPDGFLILATPQQTNIGGITLTGNTFIGGTAAIVIGSALANGAFLNARS